MKVMCIATTFTGDLPGPIIAFGRVLRVKSQIEDRDELMYEFKEYPHWGFTANGFMPVSRRCEVKMLKWRQKKTLMQRISRQLSFAFRFL